MHHVSKRDGPQTSVVRISWASSLMVVKPRGMTLPTGVPTASEPFAYSSDGLQQKRMHPPKDAVVQEQGLLVFYA